MSRNWLRLVSCVSLGVYLLANTHVSFALEQFVNSQLPFKATVERLPAGEKPTTNLSKCKHCCKTTEDPFEGEDFVSGANDPVPPCDDSSCPCCPNDHDGKQCPCPGGCVMCSIAKAPIMTPVVLSLHDAACTGECLVDSEIDYVAPLQHGLIRPPRA